MIKTIVYTNKFKKDLKLAEKRKFKTSKLRHIIELIRDEKPLPIQCRPHILSGDWDGFWECHIETDWLLIYRMIEDTLELARTGTHSDLF